MYLNIGFFYFYISLIINYVLSFNTLIVMIL